MVIYEEHGINPLGMALTRAYSDLGMMIERDDVYYDEAIDPTETHRTYNETSVPIQSEAEAEDYEAALKELGVEL